MSVRVAYVQRAGRGLLVKGVRLVSQTADATWPEGGGPSPADADQDASTYRDIASWVRSNLQGARTRDSLELLCLDASGTIYSWLTAPSRDTQVVGLLARQGGGGAGDSLESASADATPMAYFAPTPLDSTVQPLPADADEPVQQPRAPKGGNAGSHRLATLAASDLPARLLVDALDGTGVRVGEVATVWHAMAVAWDRGATAAPSVEGSPVSGSSPITGVVMIDDSARLLWCWSQRGRLLAGGSIRLRTTPGRGEDQAEAPVCSREDVARLAAEWVAWSMQLSRAPQRVVCVLPETMGEGSMRPGEVGEEVARAWPGASVDAALHEDPLGATLRRVVTHLESTPVSSEADPGSTLVAASTRPGAAHRSMHVWIAAAIALGGVVLGVLGWRLRQSGAAAEETAAMWRASWVTPVKEVYPETPPPGKSTLSEIERMIREREEQGKVPDKVERAKPVMRELEGISLVIGSPSIELKSCKVASDSTVQVIAVANSTAEAEAVLEALQRVGDSELEGWTGTYKQVGQTERVEGTYLARWAAKGGGR